MNSAPIGVSLAWIVLIGLLALEVRAWLQPQNKTARWRERLGYFGLGLAIISLIWQGIQRAHVPPLNLDELLLLLAMLMIGIYLRIVSLSKTANGFRCVGLLLTTVIVTISLLITLFRTPYEGLEPLWIWALAGRWLLLAGIAILNWNAVITGLQWLAEKIDVDRWQTRLAVGQETIAGFNQRLRGWSVGLIFLGNILIISRDLWGWGDRTPRMLLLIILQLILIAGWWLRFTKPFRPSWNLIMILLAFIIAGPVLAALVG
jgi:hypothetical protein